MPLESLAQWIQRFEASTSAQGEQRRMRMIAGLTSPSLRGAPMWFLCSSDSRNCSSLPHHGQKLIWLRKLGASATAFGENADTNRGTLTPVKKYPAINLNSCSRRSLQSYQQNLCKTLWKIMLSRLKSLGTACGNSRLHTK